MFRIISILYLLLLHSTLFAKQTSIKVLNETPTSIVIDVQIGDVKYVKQSALNNHAVSIEIDQATPWQQKACPDLPKLTFSVQIPNTLNTQLSILESDYVDKPLIEVAPSKGVLTRDINPLSLPFVYGDIYQKNSFYPEQLGLLNEPYIIREKRGQAVHVSPVQYNPITKVLRTYSHIRLKLTFEGISQQNVLTETATELSRSQEFETIYQNRFINYKTTGNSFTPISEQGHLLILTPSKYLSAMNDFITWKKMKGIKTFVALVDTLSGGINETSIKSIIKKYYQQQGVTYILLVGDHADVPAKATGFDLKGPSDMGYTYLVGGDHYPDAIIGRFSGENVDDIATQVQRTLEYEKLPNTVGDWMRTQMGVASQQGPGDDNQIDWEHIHAIVDSNKNYFNYINNIEMYEGDSAKIGTTDINGWPDIAMFRDSVNRGVSLINYAGHGSVSGIQTTSFSSTDVPLLSNYNMLPFMFIVGCRPGYFDAWTCFAEVLQRATNSGVPYGSIASFMSSIDQYWKEPMEAQDVFNAIMQGARPGNSKSRLAPTCVDACMSMNDLYNVAPDNDANDMTDAWVFFGDPTLSLYSKNEGQLSITHDIHIKQNETYYEVFCPVEGATIALYYQNELLTSAPVVGGKAALSFGALTALDTVYITATKQNYSPAFGKAIVVNWATAINEINESNIAIYPNPSKEFIYISMKNDTFMESLQIIDINGKVVMNISAKTKKEMIPIHHLSSGNYSIKINSGNKSYTTKFSKL